MDHGVTVNSTDKPAAKASTRRSRAVAAKRNAILAAALEFFSQFGIHGTSLDKVAERADVSKTNLLYYFPSKEELYIAVLKDLLDVWLAPLRALRADQHPLEAIRDYIRLKLEVSRDHPQASRLFCLEMLQGAPLLKAELAGDLRHLVEDKAAVIEAWVVQGKLAAVQPHHLIFMLWATTQHYADFSTQVEAITGQTLQDEQFFNQTVENVQRMVIEGIRVR
ncbi:HTH-type transcriptional regulator RutR [Erwinia aphidicola]|jgi:TetR/AcrR family transcriptional regulator|uniref:HTH-type transcriptional regulator RutR n=1 Tax=Erwinia aphidicola TaxID=68334 RepID=A0ABU8DB20_ERWAP|nr:MULTISPECIES: HTH-type transcriptional regulator RutR [Erwinia]KYP84295.1 TetR family transcriptional regulator [bacteria symbiont BFo1 of Frankliniella occidentalis]PIJ60131.1 TetR family transcriptional regulator [Erwinia sp. OLMDLW33]KYP89659.1 TetR family transcriptional regulator [bacteria symbiont BFo1 of Frankliniella occidentalis]MBD1374195.1 HTH-type transcriptional regulator RutR [Erwinia aphidicola]MDI3438003.1 HTH-type transcriptional regulator RutR [Erwinia sp. V90_4]